MAKPLMAEPTGLESTRRLAAKIIAPPAHGALLPRPALERRLDDALAKRLTVVVANAGFGKSTLLSTWAAGVRSCWYTLAPEDAGVQTLGRGIVDALRLRVPGLPAEVDAAATGDRGPAEGADRGVRAQAFAAALCDELGQRVRRDLVLVLDDLHELGDAVAAIRLVEALCRHAPPSLHLIVASRDDVPFPIERLRGGGDVLELGGADLAFTLEETREVVRDAIGSEGMSDVADRIHAVAGGWPVATRLAAEGLRHVPPAERSVALERLRQPGGAVYTYLAAEVFQREPPSTERLVRIAAPLEGFTADLCESLGVSGAADAISSLARRGLFLEPQRHAAGWFSLSSLVREFASTELPLDDAERREIRLRAAQWYEAQGHAAVALRCLVAAGDTRAVAGVLQRQGSGLVAEGQADAVIAAMETLPPDERGRELEQLLGEALRMRGDWDAALAAFERAAAGLPATPAGIAWRTGLIHHLQGRLDDAFAAYSGAELDGSAPADEALLLAWSASAHWLRGDIETCRLQARQAFESATTSGDPHALAAAHTALALLAAHDGDRAANDAHYLRALDHARRAGDNLQMIRIHANRGSHFAEEGAYDEALAELDQAISLADLGGFAAMRALALNNRGEVKFRVGRLDEGIADLEAAKAQYQRVGSRMVAYPLAKLGELYRERGDHGLARAACEEAIALAEEAQDLQGLVPALATLARLRAEDDPDEARRLAERAVGFGPGMAYIQALLASGWAALAGNEPEAAGAAATAAGEAARARRDLPGLAESLELAGAAATDPDVARDRLEESCAIWHSIGSPLGVAWAKLRLAGISEGQTAHELAADAARSFREAGARWGAAAAAHLGAELDRRTRPVEIRTLGTFAVLRNGQLVPVADWQSKKARDLLKILVARRGHSASREALMEMLWPEQDPRKLAGRFSVALATVRNVLDPEKHLDREHFLIADKSTVRLNLAHLDVDVERFLEAATSALACHRNGASNEATVLLELAEAAHTGDFLEEDVYEDWVVPLREEARAAYVDVARALADDARASGDAASATRLFLRILQQDPYDEPAHLGLVSALVAAGRHGEAHRFHRAYAASMEQIGVEAAPFPGPPTLSAP